MLVEISDDSKVVQHLDFLNQLYRVADGVTLGKYSPDKLTLLLKSASASELKAVCEIFINFLQRKYPPSSKSFLRRLDPFKHIIRKLACSKTKLKTKRNLLVQKNNQIGGLPFLAPLLAPIIGTLISAGIQSAI